MDGLQSGRIIRDDLKDFLVVDHGGIKVLHRQILVSLADKEAHDFLQLGFDLRSLLRNVLQGDAQEAVCLQIVTGVEILLGLSPIGITDELVDLVGLDHGILGQLKNCVKASL